jgi:iron complex transport system substrate-binding protein
VKLDKSPQRIISLAPSNTEILYALGLADRVVAVTDFDNYPLEVKEKESIGGFSTPNLEKVVSLSPDLVVAAPIHQKQVIPQLEAKGITVLALAPRTLDEVMAAITMVGKVTGTERKASDLVAKMQRRIKAVTDKTNNLSPDKTPKVMYVVWHDPLMASGQETFHDELIKKAGGVNTFGTLKGYPSVSLEAVIEANPAVILAGIGMGQGEDAPLQFALTDARLRDVDARRNNRVHGVNSDTAGRAGPRIVDVLEEFAKLIHPELFK